MFARTAVARRFAKLSMSSVSQNVSSQSAASSLIGRLLIAPGADAREPGGSLLAQRLPGFAFLGHSRCALNALRLPVLKSTKESFISVERKTNNNPVVTRRLSLSPRVTTGLLFVLRSTEMNDSLVDLSSLKALRAHRE